MHNVRHTLRKGHHTWTEPPKKSKVPDSFVPLETKARRSLTALGPKSGIECTGGKMMVLQSSSHVADLIDCPEKNQTGA